MSKKLFFIIGLLIAFMLTFSVTSCFATDGNGAMNAVNNAANTTHNTVGMNNNNNTLNNNNTTAMGTTNTGYTANRTATTRTTTANTGTFLGMTSTAWTWLILAIAAVVIVALVWYYSNQISNSKKYDE